jgi:two-component system chemotaxis response regulator CheY
MNAFKMTGVTPATSGLSVLVVEDDPSLRRLYRSILREAGYLVMDVEDGVAALRTLEIHRPAAVVLDLALPRLGGRDVHREMQSHAEMRRIPVVVVTGTDTSDLKESEFASVLKKPLHPDHLLSAVQNCIGRQSGSFL